MDCKIIKVDGSWNDVYNLAISTEGKGPSKKEPSKKWIKRMLLSEHTPIRGMSITARWTGMPYWVAMHLDRHKIGVEWFVSTQRSDKTGVDRDELPQNTPVNLMMIANPQALINIARKRFCSKASHLTTHAMLDLGLAMKDDPGQLDVINECMVPECTYRGFCPLGSRGCRYSTTDVFKKRLKEYRRNE